MTKLMEWLTAGITILVAWLALLYTRSSSSTGVEWYIKYFPLLFALTFGLYAFSVVMYRTFTFNNCEEAAAELQRQIQEARTDLKSKGIVFDKKKE